MEKLVKSSVRLAMEIRKKSRDKGIEHLMRYGVSEESAVKIAAQAVDPTTMNFIGDDVSIASEIRLNGYC